MVKRRLFDVNNDVYQELVEDNSGQGYLVTKQDAAPIAEHAKSLRDLHGGKSKNMRLKASIPVMLWYNWMELYGDDFHKDQKLMRRLVNGLENGFRVDKGSM